MNKIAESITYDNEEKETLKIFELSREEKREYSLMNKYQFLEEKGFYDESVECGECCKYDCKINENGNLNVWELVFFDI